MPKKIHMAIVDIGAGSGRIIRGLFNGEKLDLEEAYRFTNNYVVLQGCYYWDIIHIWKEVANGLQKTASPHAPASVAVDTWGADFCEFDASGKLLGFPRSYRDPRTDGVPEYIAGIVGREEWAQITGIQPMNHITICQIYANMIQQPERFSITKRILYIADAIHYFLTGKEASDFTNNAGTGAYDWKAGRFSGAILSKLGLDESIFAPELATGTALGRISGEAAKRYALPPAKVIVAGGHDSGVAAILVPKQKNTFFFNCGTWGVLGYLSEKPDERTDIFVNFGAASGGYLVNKMFGAMWFLQECKKQWDSQGKYNDYAQLEEAALSSVYDGIFNVEASCFNAPTDMISAIAEYMKLSGQPEPESVGDFARAILRSIALQCAYTLSLFETEKGLCFESCYFVGGANRNRLFCQMLADITGCEVIIGPSEGTAYANGCMQLVALGELKIADISDASYKGVCYSPENVSRDSLIAKYIELKTKGG